LRWVRDNLSYLLILSLERKWIKLANKDINAYPSVDSINNNNFVFVSVGGTLKKIKKEDLLKEVINALDKIYQIQAKAVYTDDYDSTLGDELYTIINGLKGN
jgi:hypothetical protein